jgi:hypothetical protein
MSVNGAGAPRRTRSDTVICRSQLPDDDFQPTRQLYPLLFLHPYFATASTVAFSSSEVAAEGKTEVPSMTIFWSFLNPRPVKGCSSCWSVGGQNAFQGWRFSGAAGTAEFGIMTKGKWRYNVVRRMGLVFGVGGRGRVMTRKKLD